MPLTAQTAIRMYRQEFAGDAPPAWSATKVGLVAATAHTDGAAGAPTATAPGTAISGDPRVGPTSWTDGETNGGVSSIRNIDAFSFTSMPTVPAPGVTHLDVWNGDGDVRRAYGKLAAPRITVFGDTLTFAASALQLGAVTTPGNTATT
jgi:hypothetical protein